MKAIIIAGGRGTRLQPLTEHRPKALIPVYNKTIVEHQMDMLRKGGIKEVVFAVGHKAKQIANYLKANNNFGFEKVTFATEDKPLGTGGAIRNAAECFGGPAVVLNGDIVMDVDLVKAIAQHKQSKADATLTLVPIRRPHPYGTVVLDKNNKATSWSEPTEEQKKALANGGASVYDAPPVWNQKGDWHNAHNWNPPFEFGYNQGWNHASTDPLALLIRRDTPINPLALTMHPPAQDYTFLNNPGTDNINAGLYILERSILLSIPLNQVVSIERDIFTPMIRDDNGEIHGYIYHGSWHDIGSPKALLAANNALRVLANDKNWYTSDTWVGLDTECGPGVVLDKYVFIGSGTKMEHSVVYEGTQIGKNCELKHVIIDKNCYIQDNCKIIGSEARPKVVAAGSNIQAGSIL